MSDLMTVAGDLAHHLVLAVPDPSKGGGLVPPGGGKLLKIAKWVFWGVTLVLVCGVLVVAAQMAFAYRRGEGGEHMRGLGKVLGGCVLAGSASGIVAALL